MNQRESDFSWIRRAEHGTAAVHRLSEAYEAVLDKVSNSENKYGFIQAFTGINFYEIHGSEANQRQILAELIQYAICAVIWKQFKDEHATVFIDDHKVFRRLDPQSFNSDVNGTAIYQGQFLTQNAHDAPCVSITQGFARDFELSSDRYKTLHGQALYITADGLARLRRAVLYEVRDPDVLFDHEEAVRRDMLSSELARIETSKLWDVSTTVAWVYWRNLVRVAQHVVDFRRSLHGTLEEDPTALIELEAIEGGSDGGLFSPSKKVIKALIDGIDLGAEGTFKGTNFPQSIRPSVVIGRGFCGGEAGDFIGSMGLVTNSGKIYQPDIHAVCFEREKVMVAFPSEADALSGNVEFKPDELDYNLANTNEKNRSPSPKDKKDFSEWMKNGAEIGDFHTQAEAKDWAADRQLSKVWGKTQHAKTEKHYKLKPGQKKSDIPKVSRRAGQLSDS